MAWYQSGNIFTGISIRSNLQKRGLAISHEQYQHLTLHMTPATLAHYPSTSSPSRPTWPDTQAQQFNHRQHSPPTHHQARYAWLPLRPSTAVPRVALRAPCLTTWLKRATYSSPVHGLAAVVVLGLEVLGLASVSISVLVGVEVEDEGSLWICSAESSS